MTAPLIGIAFGMATGALILLFQIQLLLKKNHSDVIIKMDHQQTEIIRIGASVESLFRQLHSISRQGERQD
jgi:hypothetical protein